MPELSNWSEILRPPLTKTLGQKTTAIDVPSVNIGGNGRDAAGGLQVNTGTNHGVQLTGAPLMTPGEIRELLGVGQPFQLILLSGKRPIAALRMEYHTDENLSQMAGSTEPEPLALPNDLRGTQFWKGVPKGHSYGIRDANEDT